MPSPADMPTKSGRTAYTTRTKPTKYAGKARYHRKETPVTEDAPSVPSDETIAERRRELAELEVNIARARVSEATGVPPHLLHGTTVQDFEKQAAELKQWSTRTWRPPTDIERVRRAFSKE